MSESEKSKRHASSAKNLGQQVEELRDEVDEVAGSLGETLADARKLAHDQVRDYPYQALAVAAATGFVLGGGLTVHVGSMLLRYGGRMAARHLLQRVRQSL